MDASLESRIRQLGDLDLALLVAMVAREHCIFSAAPGIISDLQEELRLSCNESFGLRPVIIECSPNTTVDEFNAALLVNTELDLDESSDRRVNGIDRFGFAVDSSPSRGRKPAMFGSVAGLDDQRIADVIIATGLDTARESVQVQAFELLKSRRIFTRSSMHVAPKDLLFVTVLSKPGARLFRHLNDLFCISHFHAEEDSLPHLDGQIEQSALPILMSDDLMLLRELTDQVFFTAEMAQYLHNVAMFLRNSRYVKSGATATATRQLRILSRALAPLHGMNYVPPSLVALAARKVYPHRLVLATPDNEKSLLWGSDPEAVKDLLRDMTIEDVLEEVLASIETPL